MKVLYYPAGDHFIYEPIVLGPGMWLRGDGAHTRLIADNAFDMVVLHSSEALSPESSIRISDLTLARTVQSPYSQSVECYKAAILAWIVVGFSIENVWCQNSGIAARIEKDAHAGFIDKCWFTHNRTGIYLGDSGGTNITDVHMTRLFMVGEFGAGPNDDLIREYNFGIYQKARSVGDVYIEESEILRFDEGVHLEGGGQDYNHNLRLANNVIDQCNGGLFMKNFQNSILLGNQVMGYVKNARWLRKIQNCGIVPKKYENFNIFRGKGGLK